MVTATYQRPWRGVDTGAESVVRGEAKLCGPFTLLRYENSEAFMDGLDDLIARPLLSMEDECTREMTARCLCALYDAW